MTIQQAIEALKAELPANGYLSVQFDCSRHSTGETTFWFSVFARIKNNDDMISACLRPDLETAVNEVVAILRSRVAKPTGDVAAISEQVGELVGGIEAEGDQMVGERFDGLS